MQRINYSSRRPNDEEDGEEYDEEEYSSDEPQESDYTDNTTSRSNPQHYVPRRSRPPPQPTQRASSNVTFFNGASNFEINGGTFTTVNGNSYNGMVTPSWTKPNRPSAPRSKTTTSFFSDAKGFKINNGTFSSITGDQYAVTIQNGHQGQPNPLRGPQVAPSYDQQSYSQRVPPASNRNRPTNAMHSSGRNQGNWKTQNPPPREDNTSSFMQNAAASSSPTLSSQSSARRFPSPQRNYQDNLQSERIIHSHSDPPSSNGFSVPGRTEEMEDEKEIPVDPVSPPVTSQSASNTDPSENSITAEATASADAKPSFPQFSRTMAADVAEDGVMPNPVHTQGPSGNRAETVTGVNGNQASSSSALSAAPVATSEGGSSKLKFGKSWHLLNRVDKGKGKEKK